MYISELYEMELQYTCQRQSNNSSPEFTDQEVITIQMFTPIKLVKGEAQCIRQREKAYRDVYSAAVSKVRQPVALFFNRLNEKPKSKRLKKSGHQRINCTCLWKDCSSFYFSYFLTLDSHYYTKIRIISTLLFVSQKACIENVYS